MARTVVQWIKPPLAKASTPYEGVLSPGCFASDPTLINVPEKPAEDGLSTWAPDTYVEEADEVPGSCL